MLKQKSQRNRAKHRIKVSVEYVKKKKIIKIKEKENILALPFMFILMCSKQKLFCSKRWNERCNCNDVSDLHWGFTSSYLVSWIKWAHVGIIRFMWIKSRLLISYL